MSITIRPITGENAGDLRLPNEPFSMPGKFIPSLKDGLWDYRVELFPQPRSMVFPDENYDFEALSQNSILLGAYEGERCVGLGIFQAALFKYMYLYDLKVNASHRGKGVGRALVEAGLREAKKRGYRGIQTAAQDNNLNACLFYLAAGFQIGGFDNKVYTGTNQEGKADILFYLD